MSVFFLILGSIAVLNAIWWVASMYLSRGTGWRYLNLAFLIFQVGGLAWLIGGRMTHSGWDRLLPKFVVSALLSWHMLLLPVAIAVLLVSLPVALVFHVTRWIRRRENPALEDQQMHGLLTRRQFMGFAAAALPPVLTFSLTGAAMRQLNGFRIRRIQVPIRDLPPDLHGMTIAQVSDMHVGRFTKGRVLRDIVNTTNELRADLIVLTGDLINDALADLDHGLDLVRQMSGQFGVYLIEGNHDLIENGREFERRVKASGIPFLLDESTVVTVRGMPIQLFGLSWTRVRENRDAEISAAVQRLLMQSQPGTFPILLAHHPHAFDAAAASGIPLTLAGHTHGGQLMLNEKCGFGPVLFRYWSGRYQRGRSNLVVSNGVGNWYPIRINAPAEIIHLTLARV